MRVTDPIQFAFLEDEGKIEGLIVSLPLAANKFLLMLDLAEQCLNTEEPLFIFEHAGPALLLASKATGEALQSSEAKDPPVPDRLLEWINNPNGQGASSWAIIHAFMGADSPVLLRKKGAADPLATPADIHDFRSCERLLTFVPSWRPRMYEVMGGVSSRWGYLSKNWEAMSAFASYVNGQCRTRREFDALFDVGVCTSKGTQT